MNRFDLQQLKVGDEVAMQKISHSAWGRNEFKFGNVAKVTTTQVTVALANTTSDGTPEQWRFTRSSGKRIGDSKWYSWRLCEVKGARATVNALKEEDHRKQLIQQLASFDWKQLDSTALVDVLQLAKKKVADRSRYEEASKDIQLSQKV